MDVLFHVWRKIILKFIRILSGTQFFELKRVLLNTTKGIHIGRSTKIVGPFWAGSVSVINIGENCFINRDFNIEGNGEVLVGNNVDVGPNVRILTGGHVIGDHEHRAGKGITYNVKIGNGIWIGANSTLLGNIFINDGCVVGANTLVNKSFEKDLLIVGIPGRVKRILTK